LLTQPSHKTIYKIVNFKGDVKDALTALCAAMVAIVVWATAAWAFGIPTSESHALIAGISGAAIALQKSFSGINPNEWVKVIYGLVLSTVLGFALSYFIVKAIEMICRNTDRRKTNNFFRYAQIGGGAAMAFMHGAQDGQKFMGVFMLGMFLAQGNSDVTSLCHTYMAYAFVLGCHGAGNIYRWIPYNKSSWDGYG
jgi:PiT family inorganic phosphate transporter